MRISAVRLWSFFVAVSALSCREPYESPVGQETRYLVVDGFLDARGPAAVNLSRTLPLHADEKSPPETGAQVVVESDGGAEYVLTETEPGKYMATSLPVDNGSRYRVRIRTSDGMEYFSEYVPVKVSPPIDSVYWQPKADGVHIYVDTHDASNTTRYYKWDVVETFEYNAPFSSGLLFIDGVVSARQYDEMIYVCWQTEPDTRIFTTSTMKLETDVVSFFPLIFLERGSPKLMRSYSILVKQHALTEEGYNYWKQLEQTTENLGGLFDPIPGEVRGNIYNATRPSEPVLGFFSAGTVQESRIFIDFFDLPEHLRQIPLSGCVADTILVEDLRFFGNSTLLIHSFGSPVVVGYLTSANSCIDCRLQGGTTKKPEFWK